MSIYLAASSAPHIFDFINRLRNDPRSSLWTIPERPELAQSDHPEILEALRARDGERASALMRTHILNGKNLVLDTPAPDSASAACQVRHQTSSASTGSSNIRSEKYSDQRLLTSISAIRSSPRLTLSGCSR